MQSLLKSVTESRAISKHFNRKKAGAVFSKTGFQPVCHPERSEGSL